MDSFIFDFDTDSTVTNDTNSTQSDLDWAAFQSASSPLPTTSSPFTPLCLSQQDDAVAPNKQSAIMKTSHHDELYFEIEHLFNGLNQPQQQAHTQPLEQGQQGILESIDTNMNISDSTMNNRHHFESPVNKFLLNLFLNL